MNESVYSLKFTTFINENIVCHNYKCMVNYQYMLSNVTNNKKACENYEGCTVSSIRLLLLYKGHNIVFYSFTKINHIISVLFF